MTTISTVGRLATLAVAVPLVALAAAGCGSGDGSSAGTASTAPSSTTGALVSMPAAEAIAKTRAIPLVSTINGTVPPGRPTLVASSTQVLQAPHDGGEVRVFRDVRLPGTRAPIHVHPYGGWTCVVKGEATLYVQGGKPAHARAGQCVNMPPLTPMSNSNEGTVASVLLDNFVLPPGVPQWRIVEKGLTGLGDEFATGDHEKMNHP